MKTSAIVRSRLLLALLGILLVSGGCTRQVTRMAPEQAVDLSGRWNDVDSRLVAEEIIRQSFDDGQQSWALRHAQLHGGRQPTVIVGTVRNGSMEHIPVGTFVRDLERAYVRSGQVQVVASPGEREEIRDERVDQQEHAAANTRARMAMERGADYMLQGEIESVEDRDRGRSVVLYQVDMTLVNLETNEKTWVGQHKIKKYVRRPRVRL